MSLKAVSLQARRRDDVGKAVARRLRREGRIPAVVYGKGMEPIPLSLDAQETVQLFHSIPVANTVLQLDVGEGETLRTLVREIQTHSFRPDVLHVDFMRLRRGVAVELNVPISLSGTPAGTLLGGHLDVAAHEARVRCPPADIPESIRIDVSGLELGDSLRLGEVDLPDGVELVADPATVVCHVAVIRGEEEEPEEVEEAGEAEIAAEDSD